MVRQNIINRRKELNLTQNDVAKKAGINRSSYTLIERGLRTPKVETALMICEALKMSINEAFPIQIENEKN